MRLDRWLVVAALGLGAAVAPGALQLAATPHPPMERVPIGTERVVPPSPAAELAITPPGDLEGAVAAADGPAPVFAAGQARPDGEVFALLVGIDDYPGQGSDLRSAVADVDTIDAALAGFGVPAGNRVVLRDGHATKAEVVTAVRSLVTQGGPGATYVLAFAGHVRKLDPDTEALVLADGGLIPDVDLAALVAPATTQRMWFILASCYSGGFTELLAPGRVLTAAAGAQQLAWEDPALNASYLVHYLVREGWLEGKAGDSVQEAFAYADQALARDRPNRRPVQIDDAGAPLVLGPGDPTTAIDIAPEVPQSASAASPSTGPPPAPPAPPSPPPSTPPDDHDEPCVLGVLYC
ncbi:MAG: caspase family protein [Acidimicrobiales bacterium]